MNDIGTSPSLTRVSPLNSLHSMIQACQLQSGGKQVAALAALMLFAAFTEGFGLLLLVPMLGSLGAGQAVGGGLAPLLETFGITQEPGPLLALFVALVVLRAVIGHYRTLAALRFEIALVDGTRRRAWHALLHCDWRVLSNMRQSESASLLITSIDRMGLGVNQILAAATTSITLGAIGLAALAIAPGVALGAAVGGALVMLAYRRMRRHAGLLGEQLGAAYADVYGHLQESLGALRVIKSFGREDLAESNIADAFTNLRMAQISFLRDQGLGRIALQGGGALLLALLVWLAITRWHLGAATILPMVALFARALPLLGALQEAWQNWAHARPAIVEALALIETAEAAREPNADAIEAPTMRQAITLSGVTVSFPDRAIPALDAVDLAIPANGLIALTGRSGAGKSTLADLLGGLIAPTAGHIAIDGVQLDDGARLAWRRRVAYVQQEPVLFSGSIRDNLLWVVPEASEEQLWQALGDASAMFVADLPAKLDELVGDDGRKLSGGERQRIVLARALLREPQLLILDEATSALDDGHEAAIIAALQRLRGRLTIVVICHRGAFAEIADRMVSLEHGRIVAVGDNRVTSVPKDS